MVVNVGVKRPLGDMMRGATSRVKTTRLAFPELTLGLITGTDRAASGLAVVVQVLLALLANWANEAFR